LKGGGMDHEVVVRGTGEVRVMPDLATVRLLVDGDGPTREKAYAVAAKSATAVDRVLQTEADAFDRVMTAALVVQPLTRFQKGETVRTGWRASRASLLEIRALDRLGDLLAQLTASGAAVSGLTWELDPANAAYDDARARAGQDARRRAEQYASALGVTLGAIAWIAEPGLRGAASPPSPPLMRAAVAPMAAGAPGPDTIDVAPEELTVTASIEVAFAIADSPRSTV
jgi:uncharacterized protein YggE